MKYYKITNKIIDDYKDKAWYIRTDTIPGTEEGDSIYYIEMIVLMSKEAKIINDSTKYEHSTLDFDIEEGDKIVEITEEEYETAKTTTLL